ncbi:NUDIX domain-containing protein [Pseudomonas luteola]
MQQYTLGLAFDLSRDHVLLIEKRRPLWQAGRWNGVGGHIESGETPIECMVREFKEETGLETSLSEWMPLCTLEGDTFKVHTFLTFTDAIHAAKSLTDELVFTHRLDLNEIARSSVSNLPWLISLALDTDQPRISLGAFYSHPQAVENTDKTKITHR